MTSWWAVVTVPLQLMGHIITTCRYKQGTTGIYTGGCHVLYLYVQSEGGSKVRFAGDSKLGGPVNMLKSRAVIQLGWKNAPGNLAKFNKDKHNLGRKKAL